MQNPCSRTLHHSRVSATNEYASERGCGQSWLEIRWSQPSKRATESFSAGRNVGTHSMLLLLAGSMSHQPAYQPPVVYQQGSPYPPGNFPGSQPYGSDQGEGGYGGYSGAPVDAAGWMAPPPAANSYAQQQPYAYQQQQQQPYVQQQSYPQQQQSPSSYGQSRANQYGGQQQPAQYMPPTSYQPAPAAFGRKKALLIGCCYPGTSAALNGCINDVQCVEYCLKHRFGFKEQGCIVVSLLASARPSSLDVDAITNHHAVSKLCGHHTIPDQAALPCVLQVLRDDQRHPDFTPTRANIFRGIQWLMMDQR